MDSENVCIDKSQYVLDKLFKNERWFMAKMHHLPINGHMLAQTQKEKKGIMNFLLKENYATDFHKETLCRHSQGSSNTGTNVGAFFIIKLGQTKVRYLGV